MCNANKIKIAVNKGKEVWKIKKGMECAGVDDKNTLNILDLEERGIVADKDEIADDINKYLVNIGHRKIGSCSDAMRVFKGIDSCNSYFSQPVSKQNVIDTFKDMMTCGPDGIPVAITKK